MSYAEYLQYTGDKDTRQTWIAWKCYCGMSLKAATRAAYDSIWGYQPIK